MSRLQDYKKVIRMTLIAFAAIVMLPCQISASIVWWDNEIVSIQFDDRIYQTEYSSENLEIKCLSQPLNTYTELDLYKPHVEDTGIGIKLVMNDYLEVYSEGEYSGQALPSNDGWEYFDAGNEDNMEFLSISIAPDWDGPGSYYDLYDEITKERKINRDDIECITINGRYAFWSQAYEDRTYFTTIWMLLPDGRLLEASASGATDDVLIPLYSISVIPEEFDTLEEGDPGIGEELDIPDVYGQTITAGVYEQDCNPDNGMEPISWVVVDTDGDGYYLMVSSRILDFVPYNEEEGETNWEECSLRKWLNTDFYDTAFSDSEKKYISELELYTFAGEDTITTVDKVHVFDDEDFSEYMDSCSKTRKWKPSTPTKYAYYNLNNEILMEEPDDEDMGCWLRNVDEDGDPTTKPDYGSIVNDKHGVRPVIWASLDIADADNRDPQERGTVANEKLRTDWEKYAAPLGDRIDEDYYDGELFDIFNLLKQPAEIAEALFPNMIQTEENVYKNHFVTVRSNDEGKIINMRFVGDGGMYGIGFMKVCSDVPEPIADYITMSGFQREENRFAAGREWMIYTLDDTVVACGLSDDIPEGEYSRNIDIFYLALQDCLNLEEDPGLERDDADSTSTNQTGITEENSGQLDLSDADTGEEEAVNGDSIINLAGYIGDSFDTLLQAVPGMTQTRNEPDNEKWENEYMSVSGIGHDHIVRFRLDESAAIYAVYGVCTGSEFVSAGKKLEENGFTYTGTGTGGDKSWEVYQNGNIVVAYSGEDSGTVKELYVAEDGYMPLEY